MPAIDDQPEHEPPPVGNRRAARAATKAIDAPTIGYIATGSRSPAPVLAEPGGSAAVAYANALERLRAASTGEIFLVTEPTPGTGANAAALNLALTAAGQGLRTVLIDADGSGRGVTQYLRTGDGAGLAELAAGTADLRRASRLITTGEGERLPVIPKGADEFNDSVTSVDLAESIDRITEHSDLILIFVPAKVTASWLAALGAHADGTIVAIGLKESAKVISALQQHLYAVGAPVIGVIEYAGTTRRHRRGSS